MCPALSHHQPLLSTDPAFFATSYAPHVGYSSTLSSSPIDTASDTSKTFMPNPVTMSDIKPRLKLTSLPPEILHLVASFYVRSLNTTRTSSNIVSVLTASHLFHSLFLPKLYSSITIYSLTQLSRFLLPTSGSHLYCPLYTTDSLTINIPGVPGGGDGTLPSSLSLSRDRLLLASRALTLCPLVTNVSFEFFTIRHSEILTSDAFRLTESNAFETALRGLKRMKRFRWVPPRCDKNAIMGLSIVIVDQVIPSLARGLVGCTNLESLELWNTMLPNTGGADLASSLIHISQERSGGRKGGNVES